MSGGANSSPELDPAHAGPTDVDEHQRRFPRIVRALRAFSFVAFPFAIPLALGVLSGGELLGGLVTFVHVLLSANVLACVKHGIPAEQEISRFLVLFHASVNIFCWTLAVWPDTSDNVVVLALVTSSQVKSAITIKASQTGPTGMVRWNRRCIHDASPMRPPGGPPFEWAPSGKPR